MRKTWVLAGPGDLVAVSATGGVVAMSGPKHARRARDHRDAGTGEALGHGPSSERSPKGGSTTCGETDRPC
jgi:hypothetical protein